jgi:hypothetical protein
MGAPSPASPASTAPTDPAPEPDMGAHNLSFTENVRNFVVAQERKMGARLDEAIKGFRSRLSILKDDSSQEAIDEALRTMGTRAFDAGTEHSVDVVWSKAMGEAQAALEEAAQTIVGTRPHEGPVRAQHCIKVALQALKNR